MGLHCLTISSTDVLRPRVRAATVSEPHGGVGRRSQAEQQIGAPLPPNPRSIDARDLISKSEATMVLSSPVLQPLRNSGLSRLYLQQSRIPKVRKLNFGTRRFHGYLRNNKALRSHLLACSSAALAIETESKLLDRIIRWIRELLKKCSDAALLTLRGVEVALRLSPLIILTPASVLMAQWTVGSRGNAISDWTWAYFRSAMTALGPVFVKLCQWVATRRDIFPPHICDRLADLHDRGTQHSWKFTRQELIAAFGEDYQLDGLHIEEDAVIGCGSAAQVYRGTLLQKRNPQTGETASVKCPVAIKVLHPDFDRLVKRDLWFMQTIAEMLHSLPIEHLKMLNLPRACSNFGNRLEQQADLRIEAENLKHFRANFYRNDDEEKHSSIHFPKPMDGWISRNVLVEELIDHAEPIADFLCDASAEGKTTRKELAGPLLRAFLKMVFIDNFVHCDLHPGNVLIQTSTITVDNARGDVWWNPFRHTAHADTLKLTAKKRQIVFLDAGIAASLSKEDQRNLHDLFRAVITNNGNEAGRLMVERAKYERCSQVPGCVDQFATGVGELVEEFHDRRKSGLTLGAVRIGSLLARVLDLCRVHGVEIDPAMASVVISTLVLEGLGRSLEPNLNLIDFAVPFVLGRGRV